MSSYSNNHDLLLTFAKVGWSLLVTLLPPAASRDELSPWVVTRLGISYTTSINMSKRTNDVSYIKSSQPL